MRRARYPSRYDPPRTSLCISFFPLFFPSLFPSPSFFSRKMWLPLPIQPMNTNVPPACFPTGCVSMCTLRVSSSLNHLLHIYIQISSSSYPHPHLAHLKMASWRSMLSKDLTVKTCSSTKLTTSTTSHGPVCKHQNNTLVGSLPLPRLLAFSRCVSLPSSGTAACVLI